MLVQSVSLLYHISWTPEICWSIAQCMIYVHLRSLYHLFIRLSDFLLYFCDWYVYKYVNLDILSFYWSKICVIHQMTMILLIFYMLSWLCLLFFSFVRIILDGAVGSVPRQGSWRTQPEAFVEHVITKSVPYANCKIPKVKGKKKMSQFVKKRLMQHAMGCKSGFVETKDGPAVISYGTYGPNGKLE